MKTRFPLRPLVAAVTAALALSLGAIASACAAPRGDGPGPAPHKPGHALVMEDRAMGRLHDELKLDEKQEALWKDAEKFDRDHRETMRERFRKQHDEIKAMLDQPGADLRAIAKRMDELRAEGMKERDAVRDRWLTVFDSLNAEQREKVRMFFKSRYERMAEHPGAPGKDRPARIQPRETPPAPKN